MGQNGRPALLFGKATKCPRVRRSSKRSRQGPPRFHLDAVWLSLQLCVATHLSVRTRAASLPLLLREALRHPLPLPLVRSLLVQPTRPKNPKFHNVSLHIPVNPDRAKCGNLRPPDVRHLAAPLLGLLGCFRFWECRSLGGREVLAAKDAKKRKESARPAPNVVQWFHIYDPIRS